MCKKFVCKKLYLRWNVLGSELQLVALLLCFELVGVVLARCRDERRPSVVGLGAVLGGDVSPNQVGSRQCAGDLHAHFLDAANVLRLVKNCLERVLKAARSRDVGQGPLDAVSESDGRQNNVGVLHAVVVDADGLVGNRLSLWNDFVEESGGPVNDVERPLGVVELELELAAGGQERGPARSAG